MPPRFLNAASADLDRILDPILGWLLSVADWTRSLQLYTYLRKQLTFAKISFNIIFHGLHLAVFIIGWWSQESNQRLAALNGLTFSVWLSRGAGLVLTIDTTIILLPMCRNIMTWLRPKMRWLPLDETQFFHRQCAYSLLFWTCIHVLAHYVNFYNVEKSQVRPEAAVQIHYEQAGGITGHVMLLCMFLMFSTSHFKIRQQSFETFWYTHHLFVPFLLAMYTHATGCFVRDSANPYSPFDYTQFWDHCIGYEGWRWEIAAGALYLAERITREVRGRRETRIIKVIKHPYDAIEIQFTKPSFKYKAGQWLFLNVPSVSKHQWHPFTITSCPFDPYISVHVRQVGDFTRDLASALGATTDDPRNKAAYENVPEGMIAEILPEEGQVMPELRIDGPYGAPAEDVFENEVAVLIGTGIGVTPWAAILKNIWHLRNDPSANRRLKRVEFIWVSRDTESFEWFKELLASLEFQSEQEARERGLDTDGGFIRIHTYLTQRINVDMAHNIVLNSVGQTKDPLTELKAGTNFGRPDFPRFMGALRDGIINQQYGNGVLNRKNAIDVGVYFCGPNVAARDIKVACSMASVPQVRFNFWKEHF